MRNNTIKGACGISRANGMINTIPSRKVIESRKYKSKHMNAWKKEVRAYV